MPSLNVKQSGICGRVNDISYRSNRSGKILKRVHELYLRNDIACQLETCQRCKLDNKKKFLKNLHERISSKVPLNHALIFDSTTIIRFYHIFEDDNNRFRNVIIPQTVWEDVKGSNPPAYKAINSLCYENKNSSFVVFMNNLHFETHAYNIHGESQQKRLERSLVLCANYFETHWTDENIVPVIICSTEDAKQGMKESFQRVLTLKEYVEGMDNNAELLDKISAYEHEMEGQGRMMFPEHLSYEQIQSGIKSGKYKKGNFQVSRENYTEALVHIGDENTWFVQGRLNCNRAVNGDIVAVELLPKEQWSFPQKIIRLRDVEEIERKEEVEKDYDENDENDDDAKEPESKKIKFDEQLLPTARVVGIIKRNWRQYCGMVLEPAVKTSQRVLFAASERLIPRIRIETRQMEQLIGKRIIVSIDYWPRNSRYPVGHYVRTLGQIGDRETENEVLLLEHDIPHDDFSEAVLKCLPQMPWQQPEQSHRVDLRSLNICSVDPPGCTDIDDALHCTQISPDLYEVGVHIADVTHFVRPGTAIDQEARHRGTTVYLCDRRIDMLPELLSGNLCSLRENEERFAFSVIWQLNADADIIKVKFHKSIIESKAALTYEMAQKRIDDKSLNDEVTKSLRNLMALSKKLKAKRMAKGALTLASSEIRFNIDSETRDPINVQEKMPLETNSLVEEFMLLANISVAEKITNDYPDCALLRRHPVPNDDSYKPLVEAARSRGFTINVSSGKALSESLNNAIDKKNAMLNTLLRMITTRCMTQAVYFSSGSLPMEQYIHFGLAAPIYTHFTSPIRRYADVMVHRLLAVSIGADSSYPNMLNGDLVQKISLNLNYRHKQAQYASRASILLNTLLYFKGRAEIHDGFIMGIRKNGIQVFVPKYGLESVVVFPEGTDYEITDEYFKANNTRVDLFARVTVEISLNESNLQHIRLQMKLVKPKIDGFSVDYILSAPEE